MHFFYIRVCHPNADSYRDLSPRPLVKSDPLNAKPLEISTKTNFGLLMRNTLKICPIDRFHVTSSLSKSKTKDPPKSLSSSGKRGGIFISVYNFSAP